MNKFSLLEPFRIRFLIVLAFVTTALISIMGIERQDELMPYPEGFREWTHIKTTLTGFGNVPQKKFDGFHHIYANDKAMAGYQTGQFPDGAIIVFDKHEVDSSAVEIKPGKRKFINVMYKNSNAFKDTGGWGFEEFTAESRTEGRLTVQRQQNCFNSCHAAQKKTDFVFTRFKE